MKKSKNYLRSFLLAFASFLVLVMLPLPVKAAANTYQVTVEGPFLRSVTTEFVRMLNEERTHLGIRPVQLDGTLTEAAEHRVAQASVYYSHFTPTNGDPFELPVMGGKGNVYGEIMAYVYSGFNGSGIDTERIARQLYNGWAASPGHYRIMTDKDCTKFGLGVCYVDNRGDGFVYGIGLIGMDRTNFPLMPYTQGYEDVVRPISFEISPQYLQFETGYETYLEPGETTTICPMTNNIGSRGSQYSCISSSCGTWTSSNPSVATIDAAGRVQAISEGSTTMTFCLNGSTKTYQELVEVENKLNGFVQHDDGSWWYYKDGNRLLDWQTINGKTYYFELYHNTGMVTGKYWIDGKYYYFHETEGYLLPDEPEKPDPTPTPDPGEDPEPTPTPGPSVEKPASTNLYVADRTTSEVTVTWNPIKEAEGYTIWYRSEHDTEMSRYIVKDGDVTSWTKKGLQPGTKYFFAMRSWVTDAEGNYIFSEVSPTQRGTTKPQAAKIQSVSVENRRIKVRLAGTAKGAEKYSVCYSKAAKGFVNNDFTVGIRTSYTTRTMKDALPAGTYWVAVKSYRDLGNNKRVYGAWSNTVKVTVK